MNQQSQHLAEATGNYVLLNVPPTGKVIRISMTMIDKIIDGQMVEHRGDFDGASLIQQLTGAS